MKVLRKLMMAAALLVGAVTITQIAPAPAGAQVACSYAYPVIEQYNYGNGYILVSSYPWLDGCTWLVYLGPGCYWSSDDGSGLNDIWPIHLAPPPPGCVGYGGGGGGGWSLPDPGTH